MSQSPQPAIEGRIVHVQAAGVDHCQPAIVVRSWGDGTDALNLVVFRDGSNDHESPEPRDRAALTDWRTSVGYASLAEARPFSWHWPTEHGA